MYSYECECNVYRTCSNGAVAKASAILIALTTSKKSLLGLYQIIELLFQQLYLIATPQTTTVTKYVEKKMCLDGAFNTAQYVLVIMTNCFLLVSSLLFHFSFHGTINYNVYL